MNIALFSDIHANLPALNAMFADLDDRKVDAIYCLGDLVGYHVWPNEVIELIRAKRIPVISGNHDAKVEKIKARGEKEPSEKNYAYNLINDENASYLRDLPAHIRLEYHSIKEQIDLLMVHGSPRRNDEYVLSDTPESEVLQMMQEAGASILCVAHSHKPYHRIVKLEDQHCVHIINTGSVGKPKDGNPQGGYVILELSSQTTLAKPESIKVEFIRFDYDLQTAIAAIEASPLPNEFADMLRDAY